MKPWTYKTLNLPETIQIAGVTFAIKFDEKMMETKKDPNHPMGVNARGNRGRFSHMDQSIYLWPGDDKYIPTKKYMMRVLWEELMHAILYVTHFESSDFVGKLYRNESFVGTIAELVYQVEKQLNVSD